MFEKTESCRPELDYLKFILFAITVRYDNKIIVRPDIGKFGFMPFKLI